MDFVPGHRAKNKMQMRHSENVEIGLNSSTVLTIKLPVVHVLRLVSRSLFLAIVIVALPSIVLIINGSSNDSDSIDFISLRVVFRVADEGLLKKGQQGLIVSSGTVEFPGEDLQFLKDNNLDLIIESDLDRMNSIPREKFDFVFIENFQGNRFADRILRVGGIIIMQLSNDPSKEFQLQSNYKMVYIRKFDSTVIAMRKISSGDDLIDHSTKRKLYRDSSDDKKMALEGLEDVLLEPPRRALSETSNGFLRKMNFLPDLLGDSLASYERRIFITDAKDDVLEWFHKNYPTRNQPFEDYNLDINVYEEEEISEGSLSSNVPPVTGVSNWLLSNVKKEDYVVMKAEAKLVDEMIEKRAISLVDELFLECRNQWGGGQEESWSKRAYWQCLALYGRLRDEGVAVHQWWG